MAPSDHTASTTSTTSAPEQQASVGCNRFAVFADCPLCGGTLHPEHAHFKCRSCGWRDSCCD